MNNTIYISYKWSHSDIVDIICDELESNGLQYKRDVNNCNPQDSITGFEEEIGRGKYIIVVLSDDYFDSLGCMYEMACITEHGNIGERVIFVDAMENVKRDMSFDIIMNRWNDRYDDLCGRDLTGPHIDELAIVDKIKRRFPDFWSAVKDNLAFGVNGVLKDHALSLASHLRDIVGATPENDASDTQTLVNQKNTRNIQMGDKSVYIENFSGTLNIH